jgi:hypothetical protein
MIELLLSCNVETGDALLHAIDEEFVEGKHKHMMENNREDYLSCLLAVELLLHHEDLKQEKNRLNNVHSQVSGHKIT